MSFCSYVLVVHRACFDGIGNYETRERREKEES